MKFIYYTTCYPPYSNDYPISYDYSEVTPLKIKRLTDHNNLILVHSGNWWSMKNINKRTSDSILENSKKIFNFIEENKNRKRIKDLESSKNKDKDKLKLSIPNVKFVGLMSCNEQPYTKSSKPYWIEYEDKLVPFIEKSINNADYMLDHKDFPGKLYCTIQVANAEQAKKYFSIALAKGHKYFSIGVSEFLRYPKYKFEGIKRIFEIIKAIKSVIGSNHELHISGLSAYHLIPFIYLLGVKSCDGSTPIQSALAYGVIFNSYGKSLTASKLNELKPYLNLFTYLENQDMNAIEIDENDPLVNLSGFKWFFIRKNLNSNSIEESSNYDQLAKIKRFELIKCDCEICNLKTIEQRINSFNQGIGNIPPNIVRVIHNLKIWSNLIKLINQMKYDEFVEFIKSYSNQMSNNDDKYIKKVYEIYRNLN